MQSSEDSVVFYWQNAITELIGCYIAGWSMLGRQLCSCWHCGVWSTCTPFQYVSLSKPRERSLSGWLGNAKTQMLGSHVYLFPNRSNMVISARFFLARSQAFCSIQLLIFWQPQTYLSACYILNGHLALLIIFVGGLLSDWFN